MKKILFPLALTVLAVSGCFIHTPTVSSSVVDADKEKGSLISINASHCGVSCDAMMLDKAKEVCNGGYSIHSRNVLIENSVGSMVVRCSAEGRPSEPPRSETRTLTPMAQ